MRKLAVSILVALLASLSLPALASAGEFEDFELFLDQGRLQLNSGGDAEIDVVAPDRDASNFSGSIEPDGEIDVAASDADFTAFRLEDATRVSIEPLENVYGISELEEQPGALFLSSGVAIEFSSAGSQGGCRYETFLVLDTELSSPDDEFAGERFLDGFFGDGSLVAEWEDLGTGQPVGAMESCAGFDSKYASLPGALQLGFPVGPRLETSVSPRADRVRQGGTATYRLEVRALDTDEPATVKVCGQLRPGLSVVGGNCRSLRGVDADGEVARVKVKASRDAKPGNYDQLGLLADAPGFAGGASRIELRVRRR